MEHPTDAMRRTIAEQHDKIAALRADNAKLVMKLNAEHLVRQNVEAENAKLRELAGVPKCEECEAMLDCDECLRADASQKERKRLDYENAKLRELVRALYYCTTSGECDECTVNGGGAVHLMPDTICDTMHDRMRELGIEVDE